ncbi:hypothetical protein N431DRAFT_84007 [Stipitochalara longipes BDJ]|nr:hypothetical protein N431DRAFT_84007 [Stipitochalara longipes BDJ]
MPLFPPISKLKRVDSRLLGLSLYMAQPLACRVYHSYLEVLRRPVKIVLDLARERQPADYPKLPVTSAFCVDILP